MVPRKHQYEAQEIVDEIHAGADIRDVLCSCTPGSGKSQIPVIFGKLIELGHADAICWLCPRKTLKYQGEAGFKDPVFRQMFNHNLSIRSSTNEVDPCRGLNGFLSTYQAVGLDVEQTVLREIRSKRYIVVLDENHHLESDSLWEDAIRPIFEAAKYRIRMTGTLERASGKTIAFTDYVKTPAGYQPSLEPKNGRVITYSRADALSERAIIPLKFFFLYAKTQWKEENGDIKKYDSLYLVKPKDRGKALYTAVNTKYSDELIDRGIDHWEEYKKTVPNAKVLIITANIVNAKEALDHLKSRFYASNIATSYESKEALLAIKQFKRGDIEILCGVSMFYEGFDCSEISHIILLTRIRSTPWLEQALARSVRVNRTVPYGVQYGHIFTLDDPAMRDTVNRIQAEQLPYASLNYKDDEEEEEEEEQLGLFDEPPDDYEYVPYGIDPLESSLTKDRELTLGDHWNSSEEYDPTGETPKTPSEIERDLRFQIEQKIRTFTRIYKYKQGQANKEVLLHFGKRRKSMTIPELQSCLEYVSRTYVVNGSGRPVASKREAVRFYG